MMPFCVTAMRSQICAATRRSWVKKSMVRPSRSLRSWSKARIWTCTETSSAETGSSAIRSSGRKASTLAMPTDTNPMGHVFGGWIMSLMDCAGKMTATQHAGGRVVTVAVSNIAFLQPVEVGDTVCCYTDVTSVGRTSITLGVEVWVLRQGQGDRIKVTDAEFTFVAVNDDGSK